MVCGPRTAASPRLHRDTASGDNSAGPQPQQSDVTDGARPKNGMHSRRKYSLLVPEESEGGRANAGPWVRGDGHGATRGTAEEGQTKTATDIETGQRVLLACGNHEDGNKERSPPRQVARA